MLADDVNPQNPPSARLILLFATWFGCGKFPKAPGTVGTLGALPLAWLVSKLDEFSALIFIFTFAVGAIVIAHLYGLISDEHDSQEVVVDEVAGFLVTMTWVPFTWANVLLAFGIFRLLDIIKPFPISYADRNIKGGVGVVADDLIAGILGNVVLQLLLQNGYLGPF